MAKQANESQIEDVSNKILTVPNAISTVRLLLVPVYLVLLFSGQNIWALVVFVIAAASDFLDGQIARRTHQVTKLGKLLDPAVDTALMVTGVLALVIIGRMPLWICVIIVAREAFLLIGGAILLNSYKVKVAVIYPGKVATTLLFFGFAGMLLNAPIVSGLGICNFAWLPCFNADPVAAWMWLVYIGLALQIGVTVYYCVAAWRELKAAKAKIQAGRA